MTGFGEARHQTEGLCIVAELRAVNNRYLKVIVRATEPYNLFEPDIEKVVRRTIRRGTIQVQIRCERQVRPTDYRLNTVALRSYLDQIRAAECELGLDASTLSHLMGQTVMLPGVAPEPGLAAFHPVDEWPFVERVLEDAIARLQAMRGDEGQRMANELLVLRDHISNTLEKIRQRIPNVTAGYRDRLLDRVRSLMGESGISVQAADLIKEIAIFAERSDIAEEVVRLQSHLEQFQSVVREERDGPGRKLEFLVQEMGRETNTIGAKASDVEISRHVVDMKSTLEKIRELIQNVE